MRLDVVVQHHPSRGHLLDGLSPLGDHRVVVDPDPDGLPSAIRTYIECLRAPTGSHLLIVQDDAAPCFGFRRLAEQAVAERPDDIVAFFVPGTALHGKLMRNAAKAGHRWCPLPKSANWVPLVATCWPVELARDFLAFAVAHVEAQQARRRHVVGDDPVAGAFVRSRRLTVWATVPCLVEHPDPGPSLVKRKTFTQEHRNRRAAVPPITT